MRTESSPNRIVEFRSDTFTKPSQEMRQKMFEAEVGDDVYGEDPTMNKLEERVAKLFNKEKALFFPTGTMSNLCAVLSWCQRRGSEVILGNKSHIYLYEQGGVSQFGGVSMCVLPNQDDGTIHIQDIVSSIKEDDFHYTTTELVAIENTHNDCGGRILPLTYIDELGALCKSRNIPLHMDGARIWNAAAGSGISVANITKSVDSVSACLSKGLGAPIGSILVGPAKMIDNARRIRKALGGGMRQSGIIAAAALQAIDDFEAGILELDHKRCHQLTEALRNIPHFRIGQTVVDSNILLIDILKEGWDSEKLVNALKQFGVLSLTHGSHTIRIVVHRNITDDDISFAIEAFQSLTL